MARLIKVTGVEKVINNLKKFESMEGKKVAVGLKRGGLFLQRKSQQIVPVDLGPLKNSAFTRAKGQGFSTDVTVGYTKGYAIYVHERLELRHKPGKEAKYLEKPAREERDAILKIIAQAAKIGGAG